MTFKALPIALLVVTTMAAAGRAAAQEPSYTIKDVKACSADAMRLCKDKLPDIKNIELCMRAHFAQLRPRCQARFSR